MHHRSFGLEDKIKKACWFVMFLVSPIASESVAENPHWEAGVWPIEQLQSEVPAYRVLDDSGPIHSLVYQGQTIDGEATEVFAFYASPKTMGTLDASVNVPGIVLIHGGGGTAFSDWVWMWATWIRGHRHGLVRTTSTAAKVR